VSSLIIEEQHKWNEEVIRTKFSENLAEKILSIPLSTEGCTDFTSWPHTKNGVYTVRSAYNLARTHNFWRDQSADGKGAMSEQKYMDKAWKKMWAIDCPNKMKVILWRMAHDCLPTGYQFRVRSLHTRYDTTFAIGRKLLNTVFYIATMLKKSGKNSKRLWYLPESKKFYSH
jgi:hypothetical protein